MSRAAAVLSILIALVAPCVQAQQSSPVPVKKVLDNGLTVIVKPEKGSGLVAVVALVRAGAAEETIQNAGLGNFVANLVLASTRLSSAEEVAATADEVGGNVEAQWDPDFTQVRVVTTSARFNEAVSLIGECLTEANFEGKWVEQVRSELLREMRTASDDLFRKVYDDIRGLLYEDSGYRRPSLGFERTVTRATAQDLKKFHSTYYVPGNIVICIVGDVTVERAMDRVQKAFAGVPASRLPASLGVPAEQLDRSSLHASEQEISTAYLMVGWLAPAVGSPDYPAMAVAANALGGGKGSIMFRELRQKRGMGYEVGVVYPRHKYQSHLLAYIVTDPFKTSLPRLSPQLALEDVRNALISEVDKLKREKLSATDLERAKGYTIGLYARDHQHIYDRARHLAWLEAAGVGYLFDQRFADEVAKVTAGDVQRVANTYLNKCATVLLVPKSKSMP